MKTAVFAGSFCPVTIGHVNAIARAAKLVDKLYVVVGVNCNKKYILPDDVRLQSVKAATASLDNVECVLFDGLTVDFCKKVSANAMVKVVRSATETDDVLTLADVNSDMWDGETLFIAADKSLRHVSSSLVRELAAFDGDYTRYVPAEAIPLVADYLENKN